MTKSAYLISFFVSDTNYKEMAGATALWFIKDWLTNTISIHFLKKNVVLPEHGYKLAKLLRNEE